MEAELAHERWIKDLDLTLEGFEDLHIPLLVAPDFSMKIGPMIPLAEFAVHTVHLGESRGLVANSFGLEDHQKTFIKDISHKVYQTKQNMGKSFHFLKIGVSFCRSYMKKCVKNDTLYINNYYFFYNFSTEL